MWEMAWRQGMVKGVLVAGQRPDTMKLHVEPRMAPRSLTVTKFEKKGAVRDARFAFQYALQVHRGEEGEGGSKTMSLPLVTCSDRCGCPANRHGQNRRTLILSILPGA